MKAKNMSNATNEQQAAGPSRKPRVSPELSEFMHMLSALESQLAAPLPQPASSR